MKTLALATVTTLFATTVLAETNTLDLQAGQYSINLNSPDLDLYSKTNTWHDDFNAVKITQTTSGFDFNLTGRTAATDALTLGSQLGYGLQNVKTQLSQGAITTNASDNFESFLFSPFAEFALLPNIEALVHYSYAQTTGNQDYYANLQPFATTYGDGRYTWQELRLGAIYKLQQSDKILLEARGALATASLRYENMNNGNESVDWSFFNLYANMTGHYFINPNLAANAGLNLSSKRLSSQKEDNVQINLANISDKETGAQFSLGLTYYFR